VGGILCPDQEELRFLYSISTKTWYPLQNPDPLEGKTLEIGRFHFLFDGFETARQCLLNDAEHGYDWLVVDEVGRLEMRDNQGLEPALTTLIDGYKTQRYQGNLMLVVRDFLVDEVKSFYGLEDSPVIHDLKAWNKA
jgi:nucleoside-triphosphatase THEP1